jgi:hypothetical protein
MGTLEENVVAPMETNNFRGKEKEKEDERDKTHEGDADDEESRATKKLKSMNSEQGSCQSLVQW